MVLSAIIFSMVLGALNAIAVEPPQPLQALRSLCGPFEIWEHTLPVKNNDGEYSSVVDKAWARLGQKTFELRQGSNVALVEQARSLNCTITGTRSEPLNSDGDFLSIVSTCGQFVPLALTPTFIREEIYYIFSRRGEILRKGLCHRAGKPSS